MAKYIRISAKQIPFTPKQDMIKYQINVPAWNDARVRIKRRLFGDFMCSSEIENQQK